MNTNQHVSMASILEQVWVQFLPNVTTSLKKSEQEWKEESALLSQRLDKLSRNNSQIQIELLECKANLKIQGDKIGAISSKLTNLESRSVEAKVEDLKKELAALKLKQDAQEKVIQPMIQRKRQLYDYVIDLEE